MVSQRDSWLAQTMEEPLEPGLPICDPHHHFWDREGDRYLLDQLTQDLAGGHNVVQTVFIECHSMYRARGPEEMRSVGEVEFVQGIAAQSASGQYGPTAVAAGIVGNANLMLGAAVQPVLEAHLAASNNRFRGIRFSCAWDANPEVGSPTANTPGMLLDSHFREGFACLQRLGLSFDALVYHTQLNELADLAAAFPDTTIILNHVGRPLGVGPYAGKRERGVCRLAAGHRRRGPAGERGGEAGRVRQPDQRLRLAPASHTAYLGARGRHYRPLGDLLYRAVRAATLHVREQLPGGQDILPLHHRLERFQAGLPGLLRNREGRHVPGKGGAGLPAIGWVGSLFGMIAGQ